MGRVQAVPQPPVGASYNSALEEGLLQQRPLWGHTKQRPPSGLSITHNFCELRERLKG